MPADALTRIRARGPIGIRLGLERMRALLAELGDPQRALRGVLIGGTNGKGSMAAMVASMLQAAGRSTRQSPSPHLTSYRERILVDGRPIGRLRPATPCWRRSCAPATRARRSTVRPPSSSC